MPMTLTAAPRGFKAKLPFRRWCCGDGICGGKHSPVARVSGNMGRFRDGAEPCLLTAALAAQRRALAVPQLHKLGLLVRGGRSLNDRASHVVRRASAPSGRSQQRRVRWQRQTCS